MGLCKLPRARLVVAHAALLLLLLHLLNSKLPFFIVWIIISFFSFFSVLARCGLKREAFSTRGARF